MNKWLDVFIIFRNLVLLGFWLIIIIKGLLFWVWIILVVILGDKFFFWFLLVNNMIGFCIDCFVEDKSLVVFCIVKFIFFMLLINWVLLMNWLNIVFLNRYLVDVDELYVIRVICDFLGEILKCLIIDLIKVFCFL